MGQRLFVGNLPYTATTADVRDHFASYGNVTDAKVMTDRETGQSRGFAFVTFSTDAEAKSAESDLNGSDFMGRNLVVNEAHERVNGPRPGGGSGGGARPGGGNRSDAGSGPPPQSYGGGGGGGGRDRGKKGGGGRGRDRDY